ncbi:MAG: DUF2683 family protein [Solitalea-like symbiont of Acarus siro]
MSTIIIDFEDNEKEKTVKAVLKALKIPFKVKDQTAKAEKSPYNPEFVKKIKLSEQQIKDGKCKTFASVDEFKKYYKLDEL